MIKSREKKCIERIHLKIIKATYDMPTSNIIFKGDSIFS